MNATDITHYDLRYRTIARYSASGELIAKAGEWIMVEGIEGLSAKIEGLENGITYELQVRAVNAVGPGPWSDVAVGTPSAETTE